MKEYILRTGLALVNNDDTGKNNLKLIDIAHFDIDGTEEIIMNKLKLQLCAIFAYSCCANDITKIFEEEFKKLIRKYKIKKTY